LRARAVADDFDMIRILAEVRRGRTESRKICRSSAKEVLSLQSRQLKNGM
jgi:hypothetical protein